MDSIVGEEEVVEDVIVSLQKLWAAVTPGPGSSGLRLGTLWSYKQVSG